MTTMLRLRLSVAAGILVALSLAGCGSKSSTSATSTASPSVFWVHSIAFRNSTTMTWGNNSIGQLGNGTTDSLSSPGPVSGGVTGSATLVGMIGIAAGRTHSVAFNNHTTLGWGNNAYGQVGDNTTIARMTPVRVLVLKSDGTATDPLSGVTAIAAGADFNMAIVGAAAEVWAWGDNQFGELGDATTINRPAAVQVKEPGNGVPLSGITSIAAGGSHSLALRGNGTVSSWGYNNKGQLGDLFPNNRSFPGPVREASDLSVLGTTTVIKAIAAGGSHSLALDNAGTVWAWGYNGNGQLGQGEVAATVDTPQHHDTTDRTNAVQVPIPVTNADGTPGKVLAVAAGLDHSLALDSNKNVWAWGLNNFGQLGSGAPKGVDPISTPVLVVKDATDTKLDRIKTIKAIGNTSYAIDDDDNLWVWGANTFGQLGNGTTTDSIFAVMIPGGHYRLF